MPQIWLFHLITSAERFLQKEQVHVHPICLDLMENVVLRSESLCFPFFHAVLGAKPVLKFGIPKQVVGIYCPTQ